MPRWASGGRSRNSQNPIPAKSTTNADAASDSATDFPLFDHAIEWLRTNEGYEPDLVVQLRPTTPFRPRGFLDQAIALLAANDRADCVRAVVSPNENPFKMWTRTSEGYLKPLVPTDFIEQYNMPRQALPQAWWQTGHVDVIRRTTITDARGGEILLTYDANNNLLSLTDPVGNETQWTYDALGRKVREIDPLFNVAVFVSAGAQNRPLRGASKPAILRRG